MNTNFFDVKIVLSFIIIILFVYIPSARSQSENMTIKKLGSRDGMKCWQEIYTVPRKMSVSIIEIDLSNKKLAPIVCLTNDPDGNGPAEATLTMPKKLVEANGVVAAINTNSFHVVGEKAPPTSLFGKLNRYQDGMHVTMGGWVIKNGKVHSKGNRFAAFFVMNDGSVKITKDSDHSKVKEAIAGFAQIIDNGEIIMQDKILHPRTGIGINKSGTKMWMLVIDGRQRDYSEGASTHELAEIMLRLGSWDAINLDGGGSTIMFFSKSRNKPAKQINKTPYGLIRPIPVMIGIKVLDKATSTAK